VKKTLKILGLSLAVLVGLLVVAAIALSLVFNPNQYKDDVIRLVKEKTGRDLKIEKKIGWSFYPRLGVEAGGLELGNAPGFGPQPFAKIDAAGVYVELLPLLRGRIAVDTVFLHGLNLNLAKNAAGTNNWQDMVAKDAGAAKPAAQPAVSGTSPITGLSISRLDIRRTNITWHDAAAGSTLAVRNLELATGRIVAGEPFDLRLGFELVRDKTAPIKAALNTQLTATPDKLALAKLDLKLDDSRLTGSMEVQNFANPALRFDLLLDKIDVDRYYVAEKPPAPDANTAPTSAAPQSLEQSFAALRSLDAQGKFRIQELKAIGLHLQDAQIQLVAKNGLITVGPSQAKLYGGAYQGTSVLDVRGKTPQMKLDEKLQQVQVGPLLKDMQLFKRYSGTGNIDLKLTTQGLDVEQIKKNLNGTAGVALHDGRIDGVDLAKLIEQARALSGKARGEPVTAKTTASDATVFKSLTANLRMTNGVAQNDDLALDGPNLRATGRGSVDLVRETLDYRLKVTVAGGAEQRGTTLPVTISGSFTKPSYRVDLGEVLKQEAQKKLDKSLQKGLEQLLQPKKRN
jgi:AsmA protein